VLLLTANKSLLNPLNLFKDDNLTLFLPTRWMADNLTVKLRLTNEGGEHGFKPAEVAPLQNFPEITVLTFKNVLPIKTFIKKKRSAQIAIALIREKLLADKTDKSAYDIEMFFTAGIIPSDEQLAKIIAYSKYMLTNTAGTVSPPSEKGVVAEKPEADKKKGDADALWFSKEKIVINGETFQWSDKGVIF
jgi:hypothetical protein